MAEGWKLNDDEEISKPLHRLKTLKIGKCGIDDCPENVSRAWPHLLKGFTQHGYVQPAFFAWSLRMLASLTWINSLGCCRGADESVAESYRGHACQQIAKMRHTCSRLCAEVKPMSTAVCPYHSGAWAGGPNFSGSRSKLNT